MQNTETLMQSPFSYSKGEICKFDHEISNAPYRFWCGGMVASYMYPFDVSETSSEYFDHPTYKEFLQRKGVFGRGFWVRELYCMMDEPLPIFGKWFTVIYVSLCQHHKLLF